MEHAVEVKIGEQAEFVGWWGEAVTPNKGGDRERGEKRGSALFVPEAESLTQITQQQVSKWSKRLQEPDQYRTMLYGSAWQKAMAAPNNTTATKWTGDPESYTPARYIEAARGLGEQAV